MSAIDDVVDILEDEEWHSLNDIAKDLKLTQQRLHEIIQFLLSLDLIKLDEKQQKAQVNTDLKQLITLEHHANPGSGKIASIVRQLKPTNHVLFLYESSEDKYNVLFNYLKAGLEDGEAVLYIASEESPNRIRDAMKRFGIEVEKNEKAGALHILGYNDFYIIEGKFTIPITMSLINKLYDEALTKGFKGWRATGEMACFFEHNLIQEVVEYEKALHSVFDIPIIGVCAYNVNMLIRANNPINLYNELLRAHGTVLFKGTDNELGRIDIRSD
jgi:hypothetical protein